MFLNLQQINVNKNKKNICILLVSNFKIMAVIDKKFIENNKS